MKANPECRCWKAPGYGEVVQMACDGVGGGDDTGFKSPSDMLHYWNKQGKRLTPVFRESFRFPIWVGQWFGCEDIWTAFVWSGDASLESAILAAQAQEVSA